MKLKRMAALLAILILLLSTLGVAEGPAADSVAAGAQSAVDAGTPAPAAVPLYVVLVDCGWTLYGDNAPNSNSAVVTTGDPDGLVLSYVEKVLPKLVEPEAQLMIYGYNDLLRFLPGGEPVNAADAEGISKQVDALRALTGRQSSLLSEALKGMEQVFAQYEALDRHLIIFSGGAVNYFSDKSMNEAFAVEEPRASVQNALNALREKGVDVSSYVWKLSGTERMNNDHPRMEGLLLTAMEMGEGCTMIEVANSTDLVSTISDSMMVRFAGKAYGKAEVKQLKGMDLSAVKAGDKAVILTADKKFEMFDGENIVAELTTRKETAAESDCVRLYAAGDPAVIENQEKLAAVVQVLDADGNGTVDSVVEVNGAQSVLPVAADGVTFVVTPADILIANAAEGNLVLTALRPGTASLTVTVGNESKTLSVAAADYGVNWAQGSDVPYRVGENMIIATSADPANVMMGSVTLNGVTEELQAGASIAYTPTAPGKMVVSLNVAGKEPQTREFAVEYALAEGEQNKTLALKYPYFKVQPDQTVQIKNAANEVISLEGFAVSDSTIAEIYINQNGDGLFIEPKKAGTEPITLTHELSDQTITLNLSVKSLIASPVFWLLTVAAPVCLIGLTVMIVLLCVKAGGKRR